MAETQVDTNDLIAGPLFALGSLVSLDLWTVRETFFGFTFDLSDTVLTLGTTDFSIATLMAIGALLYVLGTNDLDLDGVSAVDTWLVLVTVGLVIAPPFVGPLESFLSHGFAAGVSFLIQQTGFVVVSYLK